MLIYHFTDSASIKEFKHTSPKRGYSQASGHGVYFTSDFENGYKKYGWKSKYCYICEYTGDLSRVLDLGEYDAMYFNGAMVHFPSVVGENFSRSMKGLEPLKEPEVRLEKLSKRALDWLLNKKYQAIWGMRSWGYCCPEFCVLEPELVSVVNVKVLN